MTSNDWGNVACFDISAAVSPQVMAPMDQSLWKATRSPRDAGTICGGATASYTWQNQRGTRGLQFTPVVWDMWYWYIMIYWFVCLQFTPVVWIYMIHCVFEPPPILRSCMIPKRNGRLLDGCGCILWICAIGSIVLGGFVPGVTNSHAQVLGELVHILISVDTPHGVKCHRRTGGEKRHPMLDHWDLLNI